MSTVTVGKYRSYARKFDWDEARRRRAAGETYVALAREFGVSISAIRRACDEEYRLKTDERAVAFAMTGTCIDCGGACARYRSGFTGLQVRRCQFCAALAATTTVREEELLCSRCDKWKPDDGFPSNRHEAHRRGRHTMCSACSTEIRRKYRESRKVPCEDGCGRLVEGPGRANTRSGNNGTRIQLDPNRPHLCHSCAMKRLSAVSAA